jgi:hypothetical protein
MFGTLSPAEVTVMVVLIVGIAMVIRIFWLLARSLKKAQLDRNIGSTKSSSRT